MDPAQRVQVAVIPSEIREQQSAADALPRPASVPICSAQRTSLGKVQVVEITGNEDIEEVFKRVFHDKIEKGEPVLAYASDAMQVERIKMRVQQELEKKNEETALRFFLNAAEFPLKNEFKPWKNHRAKALQALDSAEPLPLSKIPSAILQATKGLLSDEVNLLKANVIQLIFDCLDLKELAQKRIVKLDFPFNTFISVASVAYRIPKLFWSSQSAYARNLKEEAGPPLDMNYALVFMDMVLGSMKKGLEAVIPSAAGKAKPILQSMLNRLLAMEKIARKEDPFPFAHLRTSLGSICHDKKDPLFEQPPLEFLKIAKDTLHKIRKLTLHVMDAWMTVGGNISCEVYTRIDIALHRIDQVIKKRTLCPSQLANLYSSVGQDLVFVRACYTELAGQLANLSSKLAPFWGVDRESLARFFPEEEALLRSAPATESNARQQIYMFGLAAIARDVIYFPSEAILRAFGRSLIEQRIRVNQQQVNSFRQCAEKILSGLEQLCRKHPLLKDEVFHIAGRKRSLAYFIEFQRNELKIIDEIRLGASASGEKVYHYASGVKGVFQNCIVPYLEYHTKVLIDKIPKISVEAGPEKLCQGELHEFGALLAAIEEFLLLIEGELPALENIFNEIFYFSPKPVAFHITERPKKPISAKSALPKLPVNDAATDPLLKTPSELRPVSPSPKQNSVTSTSVNGVQERDYDSSLPLTLLSPEKKEAPVSGEKRAVAAYEFTEKRELFLKTANKLQAHIKEKEKQEREDLSVDTGYNSLRNVHWKELVKELTNAGWAFVKAAGGHLQYKHPEHKELGRATVPSGSKNALSQGVVKNVRDQITRSKVNGAAEK